MTTHAKPEPIRLPVIREFDTGNGTFQQIGGYLFVPPDIARQIVAMAGIPRLDTDFIVSTEQRIAALEADVTWLKAHAVVGGADGRDAEPVAPDASAPSVGWPSCITNPHDLDPAGYARAASAMGAKPVEIDKPAAPDADEAAVEALLAAKGPDGQELRAYMSCCAAFSKQDIMGWAIAAIRAGKVPGIGDHLFTGRVVVPRLESEIAALRAKLAEAEESLRFERKVSAANLTAGREVNAERDRLAAQVESLTRERDEAKKTAVFALEDFKSAIIAERDKALTDLAAERAAHDATKDWGHVEDGKVEKLTAKLAAAHAEIDATLRKAEGLHADLAAANAACAEKQAAIEKFLCGEQAADAEIARLKAELAAATERAEIAEAHAAIIAAEDTHAKLMAVPLCREGTATEIGQAHTRIRDLERELQRAKERAERAEIVLKRHEPVHTFNGLTIDQWKERAEKLRAVLSDLDRWADAYPISVFKEPDFAKAAKVLGDHGMTLDALSASTMRMMTTDLRTRIRAAGVEMQL